MLSPRYSSIDLNEYVGIPFVRHGRDRKGCDCWGLLVLVYRERFSIKLPGYDHFYTSLEDHEELARLMEGHMGPWQEVPEREALPGDGVLMLSGGFPHHIGVVQSRGKVLHTERGAGSVIADYNGILLKSRVQGFYRHNERDNATT